jgi:hypothetical protein
LRWYQLLLFKKEPLNNFGRNGSVQSTPLRILKRSQDRIRPRKSARSQSYDF